MQVVKAEMVLWTAGCALLPWCSSLSVPLLQPLLLCTLMHASARMFVMTC